MNLALIVFAIDFFMQRQLNRKLILEKIPFFALSLVFGLIALKSQQYAGETPFVAEYSFWERMAIAGYGIWHYVSNLFLPIGLSAFYPYPENTGGVFLLLGLIVVVTTVIIFLAFHKKLRKSLHARVFYFGFIFFIINILFLLRWFNSTSPFHTFIAADRYTIWLLLDFSFFLFMLFTTYIRK